MDRFELSQKVKEWRLSDRQVETCRGWAAHGDFKRAAIEAGYKNALDSAELLQMQKKYAEDPRLMELVTIFRTYASLRTGINRDQIVDELSAMAFSRVSDYMTWENGRVILRESSTLTEAQQAAILEVSETVARDGARTVKLKLQNKQTALDKLAQLLEDEEAKVKRAGRPGMDVLAINAGNVKMMLAHIGTRKAVERLCSDFFNYDLQLDPDMQKAIAQFTKEPLPGQRGSEVYDSRRIDAATTAPKKTAREMLEIIDVDTGDPMAPLDSDLMRGFHDPKNRVDPTRAAYGEEERETFVTEAVDSDEFQKVRDAGEAQREQAKFTKEDIEVMLQDAITDPTPEDFDGELSEEEEERYRQAADDLVEYEPPPEPRLSNAAKRVAALKTLPKKEVRRRSKIKAAKAKE